MKNKTEKFILYFLAITYLSGCALTSPQMISRTLNEGKRYIDMSRLNGAKIALMPLRSYFGGRRKNDVLEKHFCSQILQRFPQLNFIQTAELHKQMSSKGSEITSRYRKLLKKHFLRGRFKKDDLAVLSASDIDYIVVITLNAGGQSSPYRAYLFLMSLQIWDVETAQMVYDITSDGQVSVDEDMVTARTALIKEMCDIVLGKLS